MWERHTLNAAPKSNSEQLKNLHLDFECDIQHCLNHIIDRGFVWMCWKELSQTVSVLGFFGCCLIPKKLLVSICPSASKSSYVMWHWSVRMRSALSYTHSHTYEHVKAIKKQKMHTDTHTILWTQAHICIQAKRQAETPSSSKEHSHRHAHTKAFLCTRNTPRILFLNAQIWHVWNAQNDMYALKICTARFLLSDHGQIC